MYIFFYKPDKKNSFNISERKVFQITNILQNFLK